jgi:hypothetical protein
MKYSIFHDFEDDGYYVANNRSKEYATEIKVYESDSLHDCFGWAFANTKMLYSDLHNEEVWCVYWVIFQKIIICVLIREMEL